MLNYREIKPKSGFAEELIILLHGYGSNKDDLITIAPELAKFLPNAHFVAPDAPQPFEESMPGARQWFSLLDRSEAAMLSGVRTAAPILESFANSMLQSLQLAHMQLAFIGFSQGSMTALHTGLRMKQAPRALLCYSGMLIAPHLLKEDIVSRPDVMLIHGLEDHILPPICMDKAKNTLLFNKVKVTSHKCARLAHGIDLDGIQKGGEFLRDSFHNQ